jgi:hypothetical protein
MAFCTIAMAGWTSYAVGAALVRGMCGLLGGDKVS